MILSYFFDVFGVESVGFKILGFYGFKSDRVQDDMCDVTQVPYSTLFRNASMTHNLQYFESASGETRCLALLYSGLVGYIIYHQQNGGV